MLKVYLTWNNNTFLFTIKILYIIKQCFQAYLLLPTTNSWETRIWFFHRNHHCHQQLIANNCHRNSKTVTLVSTTTAQRHPQSCQIQLIRLLQWSCNVVQKEKKKLESYSKQQPAILVNTLKENFADLETFKQPSAWLKIKHQVDKHGSSKLLKQDR